ncbi:nitroreductase family protein [Aquicoccus sp. G2-2]|uniref:nitroreductase family protein n=1 Tax=Aquicoccus sp. G2-2 TaxID=3092120 RepID=UPI002AE00B45|nr:nitroreductase family protein [Aquicoccus sp. G2-2]MEA1112180.1 nitroreductase family protein [Aquicoccus sp. G2-2]
MPTPNRPALDFLLSRRSRPAKTLTAPAPSRAELEPILTAAARSPDHGKLEPWRFIVIEPGAMPRLADTAEKCARAEGLAPEKIAKARTQFDQGHLAVAVVEVQKPSEKVPPIEQSYAAGGACLALLNAALASGWGANWLTGFAAHSRPFLTEALGLAETENLAGFIHIATETNTPPERPRPDLEAITTWLPA